MKRRVTISLAAVGLAFAIPLSARTAQQGNANAPQDTIVNFGDPIALTGAANQVVVPDEASVQKGGTVTFVVNGPNHGIAIYPVSKNTTRNDVTAQLCAHDPTTQACVDLTFVNADHTIQDGKNHTVIVTGTNPPFQRIDDPTDRLLATSTQIGNLAGIFLTGKTATTTATQLQFRFAKTGRYLVICMNRGHLLANWMFGFVNVVGDDEP
jgi:plastocyanin